MIPDTDLVTIDLLSLGSTDIETIAFLMDGSMKRWLIDRPIEDITRQGLVQPKMKILWLFIYPQVVPNLSKKTQSIKKQIKQTKWLMHYIPSHTFLCHKQINF